MKILVYGFEPFGENRQNVSQEVLLGLAARPNLIKVVLPVTFDSAPLINAIRGFKPDIILGLGQYPSGNQIRIEKLAKNQKGSTKFPAEPITVNGPRTVEVTLKLKPDSQARVSDNAGRYVCNFSMYEALTNPETRQIPFGFLHIPKGFDVNQATDFVDKQITELVKTA